MARSATVTPLRSRRSAKANDQVISHSALAYSRRRRQYESDFVERQFRVAQPPPGVLPRGVKIAQDEAIPAALSWGMNNYVYSSFEEGTTFLGYAYLALLSQRAEYRMITETIAAEMTREWIEFASTSDDKDKTKEIKELVDGFDQFHVQTAVRKSIESDGFMGRGHIFVDIGKDRDDRDELKTPIGDGNDKASEEKVGKGKLTAIKPIEAIWCYPTNYNSNDPLQPDWYRPNTWFCMGKEIHRTRLLTVVGREVPDLLKPVYLFGGLSMSQMAKPYIENWLRTRQSVADIVNNFSVWAIKTDLMKRLIAGGDELEKRLEVFTNYKNNNGTALLDLSEEIENVSAPLGTLDSLLHASQEQIASVARIPLVKLLGIQPSGLNASSEGEIRAFYDWIKAFQEQILRVPLTTIMHFVMRHLWGKVDEDITFTFKDLWQLDEAGRSAVEQTEATTDDTYVAMGAVLPEEIRKKLARKKDSPYAGLDLDEPLPEPPGIGELMGGEPNAEMLGGPGAARTQAEPGRQGTAVAPGAKVATGGLGRSVTRAAANVGGAAGEGFKEAADRLAYDSAPKPFGLTRAMMSVMRSWTDAGETVDT